MKPDAISSLSSSGRQELANYEFYLREQRDISPVTVRNYLSDLRSFITWYETKSINSATAMVEFNLAKITTPTLTRYRSYLQSKLKIEKFLSMPQSERCWESIFLQSKVIGYLFLEKLNLP